MPIAVLGDIHSNLAALNAVLQKVDELKIKRIFFVGDLVGYNASPAECIELLKIREVVSISGNHDRYVTGQEMQDVREATAEAIEFTRKAIGEQGVEFLRQLPDKRMVDQRYMLVHGSILDRDEYLLNGPAINKNFQELRANYVGIDICFFGHSHLPAVIGDGKLDMKFAETRTVRLVPLKQYLINPGSVGQPRDGVPLSSFAVLDTNSITIHRVTYDTRDSHDRVIAAGLGRSIAERLLVGR